MRISDDSVSSLNMKGIYSITSFEGKRYVGHAKKSFASRFKNHFEKLRSNNHQNRHLQAAWNKHGVDNFTFEILETIQENDCFECSEKSWIEFHQSWNREKGYNINRDPGKSPSLTKESRKLISDTLKKGFRTGRIKLSHATLIQKGSSPWNKGKEYQSTDHLKVPKQILGDRTNDRLTKRKKLPEIEVYHLGILMGTWESAKDLEEWSLTENNNLPVNSRFVDERMNKPRNFLQSCNINKSCSYGKPYKGLNFKFKIPCPALQ